MSAPIVPPTIQSNKRSRWQLFYGWYVVAAVFVILAMSSGLGFYNASVILAAATSELDASVGVVSGATGLFFAVSGLTGFASSRRLESIDIRWFFLAGGLVGATALAGLRLVSSVAELYIFFAVFGVGFALAGLVPATTLVTRWFDRQRSVALSIASTGLSMGGIVMTPIAAWLIDRRGLAGAALWMAGLWLAGIVPIALLVLRSRPADLGLRPDGAESREQVETAAVADSAPPPDEPQLAELALDEIGLDFARARTTRFFAALCGAYALIFFSQVGAIAQLFNMVEERADIATASTCLAVMAFCSVVARLVGGAVVRVVPTKPFTSFLVVSQAVGLALLAVTTSAGGLILSSAFFGISIGNILMLQPLLIAEAFGVVNYGQIYGFNQLFGTAGVAGGPLVLGLLHDWSNYQTAFLVAAAASLIGFLFLLAAGSTAQVRASWNTQRPSACSLSG